LEISTSTSNGNVISGAITSGDLGGLLAARSQVMQSGQDQLVRSDALSQTVNQQQNAGLDLTANWRESISVAAAGHCIDQEHRGASRGERNQHRALTK